MSIKEIAQIVGASPATVSRVLNNPEYRCKTPELRERIWKTAIEKNYTPNESARNLKMGKQADRQQTCYISVLMTRMEEAHTDPFFSELLRVIESEIHNHMCILSNVWYKSLFSDNRECRRSDLNGIIREMYAEAEQSGKNDGLIVIGKCNGEALKKLIRTFKNVVSVNRNSTNYEVDEVLCDGNKIASIAVEHLISLGHRNIAYVGACHNESRYSGYQETLGRHGIDLEPENVIETKQTEAEGYKCMEKWLQSGSYPSAVYCANDITAIGMLKCLSRYKRLYYMPSIIASDDIELAQDIRPMLTTVRLPKDAMGKFALYLLLDRIRGGHKGVVRMELEGKLVVRNSCVDASQEVWSDYCI